MVRRALEFVVALGPSAFAVRVAEAPMAGRREMVERHPVSEPGGRSSGEWMEPPAGAERAAGVVAEELPGAWWEAVCRRSRRTCYLPETPYDISDIQVARAAQ